MDKKDNVFRPNFGGQNPDAAPQTPNDDPDDPLAGVSKLALLAAFEDEREHGTDKELESRTLQALKRALDERLSSEE